MLSERRILMRAIAWAGAAFIVLYISMQFVGALSIALLLKQEDITSPQVLIWNVATLAVGLIGADWTGRNRAQYYKRNNEKVLEARRKALADHK